MIPSFFSALTLVTLVAAQATDTPDVLQVGHVLELRGALDPEGRFVAEKGELQKASADDVLIGTVAASEKDAESFVLLGQLVVTDADTKWDGLTHGSQAGKRVKVEGTWKGPRRFVAKGVFARGAGRDRVGGRVDELKKVEGGWEARVMIFTVLMKDDMPIEHAQPVPELGLAPERKVGVPSSKHGGEKNEDELFGQGIPLSDTLRLSGQIELRPEVSDNFDLDDAKDGDRTDYLLRYRARLDWKPSASLTGRLELRYDQLWRDDERTGSFADQNGFLGETFLRWNDAFGQSGFDLTLGREKFSDPRRWIYHQNLDALHATWNHPNWHLDLAGGTVLDDGSPRDQQSHDCLAYLSNNDDQKHLAAWALYRSIDASSQTVEENNLHLGVRALGEFLPQNESWIDLFYEGGSRDDGTGMRDVSAWGYDVGTTWSPSFADPLYLTWSYALGSGDSGKSGTDGTFRQTGWQDNKGKFGGVSSFRYYGELVDPELSNLGILTLGIGARFIAKTSLDLVYHTYTQDVAEKALSLDPVQSNLKRAQLNGLDADIGSELDLILGYRQFADWDLSLVGAWFNAGDAWTVGDDAFLAKVQLRYRF